ncbi:hypothetical protein Sru01_30780 [Sphaerisporangium rufum]|uniref:Secreted protein n=1 Tax=Sphaerisporangium rufum TaxID=1381558 RepID=A0A919R1M9_9ACTN|nr:hypothetical protein [Sphaerisporangium rufum]GII78096.1 hypothetical protein Sru01_30780 [Sphaerisporangium rufum]
MFAVRSFRRVLSLGAALVATGVLGVVTGASPAAATTAVLNATVDCSNVNYSGDTRDWYPSDLRVFTSSPSWSATLPFSALTAVPATHAFQFSQTLPADAGYVGVGALCSGGHQYDFAGSSGLAGIPAGTSVVTAGWSCSTAPVYPGPWMTSCSLQSISYS